MLIRSIILEANVRNISDIDHYLEQFIKEPLTEIPAVRSFFLKNIKRWIVNNQSLLRPTAEISPNAPTWAHQAYQDGLLYDFVGSLELTDRLTHLSDSLRDIQMRQPELLNRFASIGGMEAAENIINDFYKRQSATIVPSEEGEKTLIQYRDGSKWVQLESKTALKREGTAMRHCVGGYTDGQFYSYRDPQNNPHITIHAFDKKLSQVKGKQNKAPIEKYIPVVLDFLNKSDFEQSCNDLAEYDIINNKGKWQMFDLYTIEPELVDGCELRFNGDYIYITPLNGLSPVKANKYFIPYIKNVPLSVYEKILKDDDDWFRGSISARRRSLRNYFTLDYLKEHADNLKKSVNDLNDFMTKNSILGGKWEYLNVENIECCVQDQINYVVKDGEQIYCRSALMTDSTPSHILLTLAILLKYKISATQKLEILGSMSLDKAEEYKNKIKTDGVSSSYEFSSPTMKRLPDDFKVSGCLYFTKECGLLHLPAGMRVRRDVNLKDTNILSIGDNTHIVRNIRLGGSKVKKLPRGLVIGGGIEEKGALDLRGSLIKSVPDDLKILSGRKDDARIILAPDQKVKIPASLQKYVVIWKLRAGA